MSNTLESLRKFLFNSCLVVLNVSSSSEDEKLLKDSLKSCEDALERFVITDEVGLYVSYYHKTDENNSNSNTSLQGKIIFDSKLQKSVGVDILYSAAFVKCKEGPLKNDIDMKKQLHLISLSGDSLEIEGVKSFSGRIFETVQKYTRQAITPLVRSLASTPSTSDDTQSSSSSSSLLGVNDDSTLVGILLRRLRELDVALDQCQRGLNISKVGLEAPQEFQVLEDGIAESIQACLESHSPSQADDILRKCGLSILIEGSSEEKEEYSNTINKYAKLWPTEISKQIDFIDSPFKGSISEEIEFWNIMNESLADTKNKLSSPPVLLTKLVLKRTNRVSDQLIKEAESELEKSSEVVQTAVAYLREFPNDELESADTLKALAASVTTCLQHFSKLRYSKYDLTRALKLMGALGQTFYDKLVDILQQSNILQIGIKELRALKYDVDQAFIDWDTNYAQQLTLLNDVAKRRREKIFRLHFKHVALRQHLNMVFEFREQHEKLLTVFTQVFADQDNDVVNDIVEAFKIILRSVKDVTDSGVEGQSSWTTAKQMYEMKIALTEERIIVLIDDRLSRASSAEEMFRVFSTFNALFFRPAIRNAVNSYRNSLMKNVREDVKKLQEKFRFRYDEIQEKTTADLRDIPPLSGRIMWAQQIENQLSRLMKRTEDVLGGSWEDHFEGKQLKEVCDELKNFLDTENLFKVWKEKQLKGEELTKYNKYKDYLLLIDKIDNSNTLDIRVNFDNRQKTLFHEVKHLEVLLGRKGMPSKTIPSTIRSLSKEAQVRYPIAMALQASLASFKRSKSELRITDAELLVSYIEPIRQMVKEAIGGAKSNRKRMNWDSIDISEWTVKFATKVTDFKRRVNDVSQMVVEISTLLQSLGSCNYDEKSFSSILNDIQNIIDDMQMCGFSNVSSWVERLDIKVENIISSRLVDAIQLWSNSFKGIDENTSGSLELMQYIHEISLSNQKLHLSPPLQHCRSFWIISFQQYIAVLCSLPRLISTRYQVFSELSSDNKTYASVLSKIDKQILMEPYEVIEQTMTKINTHVEKWLQYQGLWDISSTVFSEEMGVDLSAWQRLLIDMKTARNEVDDTTDEVSFGPIIVSHRLVQNKIHFKYDSWQVDLQEKFASVVADQMSSTLEELRTSRDKLESANLDGTTPEMIAAVEVVLDMESKNDIIAEKIKLLDSSERMLKQRRHRFSDEWVSCSNVTGVLSEFCQILERRRSTMKVMYPALQKQFLEEDTSISKRVEVFLSSWTSAKHIDGTLPPTEALEALAKFSSEITRLSDDRKRVLKAKKSLGMSRSEGPNLDASRGENLDVTRDEVLDLEESWKAVLPIWTQLASLRVMGLIGLNYSQLRKDIEGLIDNLNGTVPKFRSYNSFIGMHDRLDSYLSMLPMIKDLTSAALKDRHWRSISKTVSLNVTNSDAVTLGDLWDRDLTTHKKAIQDVLTNAEGESALEQFFKDVKDYWSDEHFTIKFRDNMRIIVGWANLLQMLDDHLNSLGSLKQSPYFGNVQEFQDAANTWEYRLSLLRSNFENWIELQKKWMYLKGIFKSPDIKAQLPTQTAKFKNVDNDLQSLMKRVASKPAVLEILQIENLPRQLDRSLNSLTVIQKALGEYLERQRLAFPRFFFVNNDDLLEIIGNSNEPSRILSHLNKMFAGINDLKIEKEESGKMKGNAIISKEGEVVDIIESIDMSLGVKEWLDITVKHMHSTLVGLFKRGFVNMGEPSEVLSIEWMESLPVQIALLCVQVQWSVFCENSFGKKQKRGSPLSIVAESLEEKLQRLSEGVLGNLLLITRKKHEHIITEIVHQRDVTRQLINSEIQDGHDFEWLYNLRFWYDAATADKILVKMSNISFDYGFEYLGIGERLVQTPLTDRCFLSLTQALHFGMGGNPFGPAGTGKTESVKMLGAHLGRFVLVFNCDENFDYAAMGRIFTGLCQVGAWGCFDEFNRLEERILSAVSQQILTIQRALLAKNKEIDLLGKKYALHRDVGIFVTMNPGYAGRSELPDNLKQLFRAVAMKIPDQKLIAQVMLFSQGIASAEELAGKIVLLFTLCLENLSNQSHYDFGLRALKSVLVGAGDIKRAAIAKSKVNTISDEDVLRIEMDGLIHSTCNSILPKLVSDDVSLFLSQMRAVFTQFTSIENDEPILLSIIHKICEDDKLEVSEGWIEKVLQLKRVLDMRHGVMMVGPSCSGKTTAWKVLMKALNKMGEMKGDYCIIDPKAISKEQLYGVLDPISLEWTDGIFTKVLRKASEASFDRNKLGRQWIVFDGDVDPEWAENLNSLLDDNKILTLPSGDRINLQSNTRIMIEVDNLKHTTMATISRCGMVWFADNIVTQGMLIKQSFNKMQSSPLSSIGHLMDHTIANGIKQQFLENIQCYFTGVDESDNLLVIALEYSLHRSHIMDITCERLLEALVPLLLRGINMLYGDSVDSIPSSSTVARFAMKWFPLTLYWAFGASMSNESRKQLDAMLIQYVASEVPPDAALADLTVDESGEWLPWTSCIPRMEIEPHQVVDTGVVITTSDTLRHTEVLKGWLDSHKPLVLCGPPGSGKSMTLSTVIEGMSDYILTILNFSSGTEPSLILKTFTQYCEVFEGIDGLIMQPDRKLYSENKWLVVFCDEINLPEMDKYGTQRVITFMRQLTEQGGYWNSNCKWVSLKRIQFVGACNPPTDVGRVTLSNRFLRHATIMFVDYPNEISLKQIYRCFNHGLLKLHPDLHSVLDHLTNAMVDFYLQNQEKFTPDQAPHYIYSPRELSRWVRSLYEAMEPLDAMTMEELVRLWAHEATRLFKDRLKTDEEREWCENAIDETASNHFYGVDIAACLERPLLYSKWTSRHYSPVDRTLLCDFVESRLRVFYEEELDVPLVVFDDVLEHVLRIDNVLRHPMGHLLLVGASGVGKKVLTRFVAWMNGLSVFQLKTNKNYTVEQFDENLRDLLRRAGVQGEKICFIFDESNIISSAFLERMNALLASGQIPGLYEGDELSQLYTSLREVAMADSEDELWKYFTREVQKNLHVVITMNPVSADFRNRCTASPALFNRCVVDWLGTWDERAMAQVGSHFTLHLDTSFIEYEVPTDNSALSVIQETLGVDEISIQHAVVAGLVSIHDAVKILMHKLSTSGHQFHLSPRDYLDLILKFVDVERERREFLEEQQTHIRTGLLKLQETQDQVDVLHREMKAKEDILVAKDTEANEKLTQMVQKQNEAENQKSTVEKLSVELQEQEEAIKIRKSTVEEELSRAEPALLEAKQVVQNIRKAQLDEVRGLPNPPLVIRLTMEMVCILIGETSLEWVDIRKVIRRDDFIRIIVNFDPLRLSEKQINKVVKDYMENPRMTHEAVDRASKACGPLFQWVESQVGYATILSKVKPLREEVESLQSKMESLVVEQENSLAQAKSLEEAIVTYKEEYASAIRDTEAIRAEMNSVTKKVDRAEELLTSLDAEKLRWSGSSTTFDYQMSTLIGDSLISAAFLTYAGIFDHRNRKQLIMEWTEALEATALPLRNEIDMIGYLSKPSEQIQWRALGLPSDDLAIENAILLSRFKRFPLVIDPSGQACDFLMNRHASERIIKCSILEGNFMKTLANAIRFGNPLLVTEVEELDPILNPILNRELHKTGGRTLITLGKEDIDFSPSFTLFLTTTNASSSFAPDLCSRVTIVNFTVTPASLEAQVLSALLKCERPDIDRKRTEILRLQGEQNAKMRELEDMLLDKISAIQGAILNDDSVINTLEKIKGESRELNVEVGKTQEVMEEMSRISNQYEPLAQMVASIYFILENLSTISPLYQYSITYFLGIVNKVLQVSGGSKTGASGGVIRRLEELQNAFLAEICRRSLRGLASDDRLVLLFRISQIKLSADSLDPTEEDWLLKGSIATVSASDKLLEKYKTAINGHQLGDSKARMLLSLVLLPAFTNLLDAISGNENNEWSEWYISTSPETGIPHSWVQGVSDEKLYLLDIFVIKCLRPDRVQFAFERYIDHIFGNSFDWRSCANVDLRATIELDSECHTPIMLCSGHGQDASTRVDKLAMLLKKELADVAMGSSESISDAMKKIANGVKTGKWVLLRNVHLSNEWLYSLEKHLKNLDIHANFRLFLASSMNAVLPPELLRKSEVLIFEQNPGIKTTIRRFLSSLPDERVNRKPLERSKLYALLAWFHALVIERLRYAPLGWTSKYEFSETDAVNAIDTIDYWFECMNIRRDNLDPKEIPWKAIRTLLVQSLYGGRIDNEFDMSVLQSFVDSIFCVEKYTASAILADSENVGPVVAPEGYGRDSLYSWVDSLPETSPPSLLGLPSGCERELRSTRGRIIFANLIKTYVTSDINLGTESSDSSKSSGTLANVSKTIAEWANNLPQEDEIFVSDESYLLQTNAHTTAVVRCLTRESKNYRNILSVIHEGFAEMTSFCEGKVKLSSDMREYIRHCHNGAVPNRWENILGHSCTLMTELISSIRDRVDALAGYRDVMTSPITDSLGCDIWLGGLQTPIAFITATRQMAARVLEWSLEDLELHLCRGDDSSDLSTFKAKGIVVEGATIQDSVISASIELRNPIDVCKFKWQPTAKRSSSAYAVPMYTNVKRAELAAIVHVESKLPRNFLLQKGVAFILHCDL